MARRLPSTWTRTILLEVLGIAVVVAVSLVALAHVLASTHAEELLRDGDSLAPAIFDRAFQQGLAGGWTSSQVLFLFAEIPLYLLARVLTATVSGAFLVNAIFNVAILYGLVRGVLAGVPRLTRGSRVAGALVVVAVLTVKILTESTPGRSGPDIGWMYLTTTYYSGSIMAVIALLALAIPLLTGTGRWTRRLSALAIVVSAASTLSNPIILAWGVAPLGGAVVLLWLRRRITWRHVARVGLPLAIGCLGGLLAHVTLAAPYIHHKSNATLHPGKTTGLHTLAHAARVSLSSPPSTVAVVAIVLLWVAVIVGAVRTLRQGKDEPVTCAGFVVLVAAAGLVVIAAVYLVGGSTVVRYGQPAFYFPLTFAGVWSATRLTRLSRPTIARQQRSGVSRGRVAAFVLAAVSVAAMVFGGLSAPAVIRAAEKPGDPTVGCLDTWLASKKAQSGTAPVGLAQYWGGRTLQVYGSKSVNLVQAYQDFSARPWIVSTSGWVGEEPTYVIASDRDPTPFAWNDLGSQGSVTRCDGYSIHDFSGTVAGARLQRIFGQTFDRYLDTGVIGPATKP